MSDDSATAAMQGAESAGRTALLTLDLINDLVHRDGAVAGSAGMVEERQVIDAANRAIAWARREGALVVHVRVVLAGDPFDAPASSPLFGPIVRRGALRLDSWGSEFHAQLDARPGDTVLQKRRVSPFYRTGLRALLQRHGIHRLLVCGVSTGFAVEAAVRDGHDRDLTMVVVTDACAAATPAQHQAALAGPMGRLATLITSHQLDLAPWTSASA
jgi:nicotinamidase-related amidase